jgi:probable rRNA maturation factor
MKIIHFYSEDTSFTLKQKNKVRTWLLAVIEDYNKQPSLINYIFTSDAHLLEINKNFLNHDTYTDIITFDQSSEPNHIEADIYISIDRVKENAKSLNNTFSDELHRVMIHGILHLMGFNDKTDSQKKEMRKTENHYLALRS